MIKFSALGRALLIASLAFVSFSAASAQTQVTSSSGELGFSPNAAGGADTGGDFGAGIFGTLPFKLSLDVRGGYDDNVTTSNQYKGGSLFTETGLTALYNFGDARTRLNLQVGVGFTYYYDDLHVPGATTNQYDINTSVRLGLTHKASPRLTLSSDLYIAYLSEPDFAISQGINRRAGNYFYTQDKFTLNYLWSPRFATATSYTLGAIHYDDASLGFFQNYWENTFGNEFRFLVSPTTALVAEYRFELVTYQDADRDSRTHYLLAGFDHTFDPRLTTSLRGGVQFRSYASSNASDQTSPYAESTVTYSVAKRTSVSWTTRYGIEESDVAFSQSRETFRTGLTARHDFTPKITGSIGAYYEHDDYHDLNQPGLFVPGFTEQSADLSVSLRYALTRYFWVEAGYNYTDVVSDVAFREYTRNRFWGGLSVTF